MKKLWNSLLSILADAALVTFATLAVPCAVLTAYQVPFPLVPLVWAAILIGLLLSVWMHAPKLGWIAGVAYFAVLGALLIWKWAAVRYGFSLFRYAMLDLLAADVPFLPAATPVDPVDGLWNIPDIAVGWFALLVMGLFGLSIAWSLIRSKMLILPLIVPLPMFMLSLIYTDLPLAHWTVLLLLLYLGGCMIGGGLRVSDAKRYGIVMVPVILGLLLLGTLIRAISPPETYEPISFERRQEIVGDRIREIYDDIRNVLNNRVKRTEDLSDEEEWKRTGDVILELTSSTSGETYLRSYSLGSYRNNIWYSVPNYSGAWDSMAALGSRSNRGDGGEGAALDKMEIRAEGSEMLYVPYGFLKNDANPLAEAYLPANGLTEYSWTFDVEMANPDFANAETVGNAEADYYAWAKEQYVIENPEIKAQIRAFAEAAGIYDTGDNRRTAQIVAEFVRRNGTYTTSPGRLPQGKDFVLYFLQENRQGYCVHFATATTAILQSFDIPARYVSGYRFFTSRYEPMTVTDEMAHAWTEVYCPGIGWMPVESTAGSEGWQEPDQKTATPSPDISASPESTLAPTAEPTPAPTEVPDDQESTEQTGEPTQRPEPDATARPDGQGTDDEDSETTRSVDPPNLWWLLWLLVPPALVGGMWGADRIIRNRRKEAFRQKDAREAVLAMYRYQKRLERHGAPKSEIAEDLAEEATFTNHPMTQQRKQMHSILRESAAYFDSFPKWKRFLYRHLLFLL